MRRRSVTGAAALAALALVVGAPAVAAPAPPTGPEQAGPLATTTGGTRLTVLDAGTRALVRWNGGTSFTSTPVRTPAGSSAVAALTDVATPCTTPYVAAGGQLWSVGATSSRRVPLPSGVRLTRIAAMPAGPMAGTDGSRVWLMPLPSSARLVHTYPARERVMDLTWSGTGVLVLVQTGGPSQFGYRLDRVTAAGAWSAGSSITALTPGFTRAVTAGITGREDGRAIAFTDETNAVSGADVSDIGFLGFGISAMARMSDGALVLTATDPRGIAGPRVLRQAAGSTVWDELLNDLDFDVLEDPVAIDRDIGGTPAGSLRRCLVVNTTFALGSAPLPVTATCVARCTATVSVVITVRKKTYPAIKRTVSLAAGVDTVVRITVPAKKRKAIRKAIRAGASATASVRLLVGGGPYLERKVRLVL